MDVSSHNKIDQPTIQGPYSIEMSGSRRVFSADANAAECIIKWLKAFASFHMYDPAQPLLSFLLALIIKFMKTRC